MTHIKQNDPACIPFIQKSGCFERSAGLVAEYKTGKALTAEQINELHEWAILKKFVGDIKRSDGRIDHDCVIQSAPIINQALKILGGTGKFFEVGTYQSARAEFYRSIPSGMRRVDASIQKILQPGPQGSHYRLVDHPGVVKEDPHEPPITCLGVVYEILYCFVE